MGDGSPAWKWVSRYPWSSNQYRPGSCRDFPLPSVLPFLGSASSRGSIGCQHWLHRFWLTAHWDSCSLFGCHPRSTLQGVISGWGPHSSSSWGAGAWCPSQSNAYVLPEVACPVEVGRAVAAKRLWRHSRIAASAARSTGGWSASFTCGGRVNISRICVAAATTPQATLAAKSGVDMVPWPTGGTLALGVYVMQVWASRSHTKTSHLHCGVSVSMCAPGQARSLSRFKRVSHWQVLVSTLGISRWCHRGITSSTRRPALHGHVFLVIGVIVISLLEGILAKPWVAVDVVWMEDGRALWPIQIHQAPCPVHLVLPRFWIMARWNFRESSALPEQPVGKYYVRIDKGGGNYGVWWALLHQVKDIFNPSDHLLVFWV